MILKFVEHGLLGGNTFIYEKKKRQQKFFILGKKEEEFECNGIPYEDMYYGFSPLNCPSGGKH